MASALAERFIPAICTLGSAVLFGILTSEALRGGPEAPVAVYAAVASLITGAIAFRETVK